MPAIAQSAQTVRLAGPARVETAVVVSQSLFGEGEAAVVVLARADDPADAYAATPFALVHDGPILLTETGALPAATLTEIRRVLRVDGRVVVAGGAAAINDTVTGELTAAGIAVERIGGATRFDTAVQMAKATHPNPPAIVVADGGDYRFALPAGAMAATLDGVIVLTSDGTVPPETQRYLDDHKETQTEVHAVGDSVITALAASATNTYPGSDPYTVAVSLADALASRGLADLTTVTLASGEAFPDALTGGVYAATRRAPLLLTPKDRLADPVDDAIRRHPVTSLTVLGGTAAVSLEVARGAEAAADGQPAPTSDLDEARVIPGQRTHFYVDCPPAPQSPLIPVAATCVTVIATDLDGDGTSDDQLDRVLMYQQNVQAYDGQLTIAGYSTAQGTLTPYTLQIYPPPQDDGPAGGYATECIANIDADPASELLITTSVGANTMIGIIMEARDRAMLPVIIPFEEGLADFFVWSWGGGVRYGSGYRLNTNVFTTTAYDDQAGSPFGWAETDWAIDDGIAVPVADRSGSTADPSPYAGSGCPGGTGTFEPFN